MTLCQEHGEAKLTTNEKGTAGNMYSCTNDSRKCELHGYTLLIAFSPLLHAHCMHHLFSAVKRNPSHPANQRLPSTAGRQDPVRLMPTPCKNAKQRCRAEDDAW